MSSYKPYTAYTDSGVEWIGAIPEGWAVKPLFAVAEERTQANKGMLEDNLLSLSYGNIVRKDINSFEGLVPESYETYQIVERGDIVFRLTDLQNDKRSLRSALSGERGIITSAYVAVNPKGIQSDYFSHLMRSYDQTKVFYSMGGGMRQSMKYEDLRRMMVLLPPEEEQSLIATDLNRETTRIDALIAKKTRFIELLREKRQTLITHAVTKGLNPNVKMKDSRVEWLGEVPEHWEVKRLQYLCSSIKAGPFGSSLTKDMYTREGYRVYGQEQVIPADFNVGDYYIPEELFQELRQYEVLAGDVLISCVGTFGKIAVVPQGAAPGIINPRLLRLRTNQLVAAEYLGEILKSEVVYEQFSFLSKGGTMDVISAGTLSGIVLPVPPRQEQLTILSATSRAAKKFDSLIYKSERSIELLKERRSALITAAVTGQIDLREAA